MKDGTSRHNKDHTEEVQNLGRVGAVSRMSFSAP